MSASLGHHDSVSLHAQDVRCVLGDVVAVDDVSLRVDGGQCTAIVGESGAGKTTLLRCFNRMVAPEKGRVLVQGRDVSQESAVTLRRRVGYVPQHGGLLPHWSVLRNAALVPSLLGQLEPEGAARAALELLGLPADEYGDRYPHELSGGQRQRVAVARAIAAHPGVLLMDEPFGALDAISRSEVQAAFARLRAELRITTLFVTHDLIEADYLADEIVVMRAGRIEQRGALNGMLQTPATPYVESLLSRALAGGVDAVLELVGTVTLRDSLRCARPLGVVCNTGILGNAWVLDSVEPLVDIPSTVRLTTYDSATISAERSTAALQEIVDGVAASRFRVNLHCTFRFDDIVAAHHFMEENRAAGKLVVVVD